MGRAQAMGAAAAGTGVLGVALIAGSLFAFGATIGYGLPVLVGAAMVVGGMLALLLANYLVGYTKRYIRRA